MKKEDIAQLATLARIKITEHEAETLTENITDILGYVSVIDDITSGEEEKKVGAVYNVMREDVESHEPEEYTEAILDVAPERDGRYIKVKKILGGTE